MFEAITPIEACAPLRTKLRTLMSLRLRYNAVRRPAEYAYAKSAIKLEHPRSCVSHRAFAGITAGGVGEFPFEDARSQNIENNPMQSSRRPAWMLRKRVDTSGKSPAFFRHPAIFRLDDPNHLDPAQEISLSAQDEFGDQRQADPLLSHSVSRVTRRAGCNAPFNDLSVARTG
jgi:hypothetical protein